MLKESLKLLCFPPPFILNIQLIQTTISTLLKCVIEEQIYK